MPWEEVLKMPLLSCLFQSITTLARGTTPVHSMQQGAWLLRAEVCSPTTRSYDGPDRFLLLSRAMGGVQEAFEKQAQREAPAHLSGQVLTGLG